MKRISFNREQFTKSLLCLIIIGLYACQSNSNLPSEKKVEVIFKSELNKISLDTLEFESNGILPNVKTCKESDPVDLIDDNEEKIEQNYFKSIVSYLGEEIIKMNEPSIPKSGLNEFHLRMIKFGSTNDIWLLIDLDGDKYVKRVVIHDLTPEDKFLEIDKSIITKSQLNKLLDKLGKSNYWRSKCPEHGPEGEIDIIITELFCNNEYYFHSNLDLGSLDFLDSHLPSSAHFKTYGYKRK